MLEKITLSCKAGQPLSFQGASCPSRPTTCSPSYGVWFQKIINSQDLILPCHNRLCFTRKGRVLTYQMKVKHKTTFIYIMCPNSTQPGVGTVSKCTFTIMWIYVPWESVKYKHKFNQRERNLHCIKNTFLTCNITYFNVCFTTLHKVTKKE